MDTNTIITLIATIITFCSVIILALTITSNKNLNQKIIFNELVKQERELRIKLNEYRNELHKKLENKKDFSEIILDYDTLLFNYYEYLAICLYKKLINEKNARLYFNTLLKSVKESFDNSLLFKKKFANKNDYPGINWLFKKWNI